jgi:hypothetical protein
MGQTLRQVVAQLVAMPRPAAALRGGSQPVTLVYEAEDVTLTLHPQRADRPRRHTQLLGFVHQRDASLDSLKGSSVRLLDGDTTVGAATIDEIGNFIVGPVAPGTYDLHVMTTTLRIVVRAIDMLDVH